MIRAILGFALRVIAIGVAIAIGGMALTIIYAEVYP